MYRWACVCVWVARKRSGCGDREGGGNNGGGDGEGRGDELQLLYCPASAIVHETSAATVLLARIELATFSVWG